MDSPLTNLSLLLRAMNPVFISGTYALVSVPNQETLASIQVYATIREAEGLSAVISEADAVTLSLPIMFRAAWITLNVIFK